MPSSAGVHVGTELNRCRLSRAARTRFRVGLFTSPCDQRLHVRREADPRGRRRSFRLRSDRPGTAEAGTANSGRRFVPQADTNVGGAAEGRSPFPVHVYMCAICFVRHRPHDRRVFKRTVIMFSINHEQHGFSDDEIPASALCEQYCHDNYYYCTDIG